MICSRANATHSVEQLGCSVELSTDYWDGTATSWGADTGTVITSCRSVSDCWIETKQTFTRPIVVEAEMKAASYAECIAMSLFATDHSKNTKYSFETGGWGNIIRLFPGDYQETVGYNNDEWDTVRIELTDDMVYFYLNGVLKYSVADSSQTSGTLQFIAGCTTMKVRNPQIVSGSDCVMTTTLSPTKEDGLVKDDDGFVLIERHRDVANGYFSTDVLSNGLENEDDPSANTYCIIGGLDSSDHLQSDGYYDLKLIYKYSDGTEDVLEWTQSSWLTDSSVVGADLSKISSETVTGDCKVFDGLGLSNNVTLSYLDGNANGDCWYHAVASTTAWSGGIPAHNGKAAYSSSLWIQPGIVLISVVVLQLFFCGSVAFE